MTRGVLSGSGRGSAATQGQHIPARIPVRAPQRLAAAKAGRPSPNGLGRTTNNPTLLWFSLLLFIGVCLAQAVVPVPVRAEEPPPPWPQWRGPQRNGSVADSPRWPEHLHEDSLREVWRQALPPSYSGPIISHDTVFSTFTREGETEGIAAFDLQTGKARWQTEWPGTMQVAEFGRSMGSWIRATPTIDGSQLFVAGMPDLLVSLHANTGQILWQVDFKQRYGTPVPELGCVSSPLVVDQQVIVQVADSLVSVQRETGHSLWRTLIRSDVGQGAYSSPNVATICGKRQILVANIPSIAGVDPQSGELLWQRELDSYDQGCILAPIPFGDGVFTSTRASQSGYYALHDANGHFTVSDGWKNKLVAYMSDPMIIDGHAYMHLKNGRMACIDLETGKERWISNRTLGTYCSLVAQQNRILALSNEGELFLLAANPESFQLLDSRKLTEDETWGFLAIAGNRLVVRSKHALLVYAWGND